MAGIEQDAVIECVEQSTGLYYGIRTENGIMKRHGFNVVPYEDAERKESGFRVVMTRAVTEDERSDMRFCLARNVTVGNIVRTHQFNFKATADDNANVVGCSFEILNKK